MKEIRAFLYVCALLMRTVFKSVVMSNIHTVCSFKSFLSAAIPPHKSPEMSPNLGDLSRDLTLPVWRSESTTTRPCFNYRKPIWLRRYLCLIYSMLYQTIKTLDSFLTSPEILLIYSIICTSRVNILPSGLFFPPSVVSGGDERIPRLRADTCSGAVVMSAPVSLWSFGLENRKTTKTPRGCRGREVCLMRHPRGLTLQGGSCLTPPSACFKSRQQPITSVMLSWRRRLTCVKISFDVLVSFTARLMSRRPSNTPVTSSVIWDMSRETCLKMTN